jgi:hypothetical protein
MRLRGAAGITPEISAMTTSKESIGVGARAELRLWYVGRLRPRLVEAVAAGIVRPGAVQKLDLEVAELFELSRRAGDAGPPADTHA